MPYIPRDSTRPLTRRGAWFGLIVGIVTLIGMLVLMTVSRNTRDSYVWILQIVYTGVLIFNSAKHLMQIHRQSHASHRQSR